MTDLTNRKVLMLATNGFEQSELWAPKEALEGMGATVHLASPAMDSIKPAHGKPREAKPDMLLGDVKEGDYDALVLPGGVSNPDTLRTKAKAVKIIKAFAGSDRPVAAICHAPWLLIEAGAVKGKAVTSWPSLKTDLTNAGGKWEDSEVVTSGNIITSRKPDDIPAFNSAVADAIAKTAKPKRAA